MRKLCLAFPEVREVEAWGSATFRARTMFAMHIPRGNEHGGRECVWVKADSTNQQFMVRLRPDRYFVPPYVGPSGWVGVYLNAKTSWPELRDLLEDAWRMSAPKRVVARFLPLRGAG